MFLRAFALGAASVSFVAIFFTCPPVAGAETLESPSPMVSPPPPAAAAATPRPRGLHVGTSASFTLIDQNTAGAGQLAPEAAGFISGAPLSPNTPYDLFSSAPQTPGVAGIGQLVSTLNDRLRMYDIGLTAGLGYVRGSTTNAAYWGENLLPALNVHSGSQALPYRIAFPTHPGNDDATALRLSILGASIATADGLLRVRGGWFDLTQTDRFVFAQPALTSLNPQIAYLPAESLSSGVVNANFWQQGASALPLQGIDIVAHRASATLELTTAALPSLPGESARLSMGSFAIDRGEGTRFSAQVLHATTSGLPFGTTVPFGVDPQFMSTPQGILPVSILNGQRQTIAGVRAAFHLVPASNIDSVVEIGRAWYDATPAGRTGTQAPGGFYHVGFAKTHNRVTAFLDLYRMEPRYATIILPYGVPENQWSAAFSWPGQWLKSNYQLIDNSVLGVNRQGYRLRYFVDKGPFELHLEHTEVRQIEPETMQTSTQSGFIDGYYLPQIPDSITFGRQKRDAAWAAWHPSFGDLTLDIVDDALFRPFRAAHPEDAVSYEVPQAVLTFAKRASNDVTIATGVGRYAMKGAFAQPIDFAERLFFIGAQIRQTPKSAFLITFRRTSFRGLSTVPAAGNSPNFTGSAIVLEQRFQF
ncbi:MAG: hypothetical protein NVSMB64_17450 [Candidatus Velthaea sp.]